MDGQDHPPGIDPCSFYGGTRLPSTSLLRSPCEDSGVVLSHLSRK
jgi:hypothetical protein